MMDRNFYYDLEDIIEILKPLHDCQIISKSRDTHLSYIVKRWKNIKFYLWFLYYYIRFQQSNKVDNIFLP